ncbi:MAG: hypothetical protein ATN32_06950 [Candidatus Epulonipiscium fishelsonii]|nr:MAG: hypothetical protein ATN32_06950 [Epulopiscium sp. AS2M-Bin002]
MSSNKNMYNFIIKLSKIIFEENYDCESDIGFIIDYQNLIIKIRFNYIEIIVKEDTLSVEIREENEHVLKLIDEEISRPLGTTSLEFDLKTDNLLEVIINFLKKYMNYYKYYDEDNSMLNFQDLTVMSFMSMIPRIADDINISYISTSFRKEYFLEIYNGADMPFVIIENNISPAKEELSVRADGINFKSELSFNADKLEENCKKLLDDTLQAFEKGNLDETSKDKLIWLFKNCEDNFKYFTKRLLSFYTHLFFATHSK